MRFFLLMLGFCAAVLPARASTWTESFETAKSQAAAQQRPVLMYFTGSDWCPYCKQFKAAVLDTGAFQQFADSKLVLFLADVPRNRPVPAQQLQANRQLAAQYGVQGYPTVVLVTASGQIMSNIPAIQNPAEFIKAVEGVLAAQASGKLRNTAPLAATGRGGVAAPVRELPLFAGAQTHAPVAYTNLVLKSISGPPSRRFALINTETMKAGDTARFKLGDNQVNVQCVEVREKSVMIRVQGEKDVRELKMPLLQIKAQLAQPGRT